MLDIDINSKYGILFVRLYGNLTKDTNSKLKEEVFTLINKVGIQNIVINIQNLNCIDSSSFKLILKCYNSCDKSLMCINKNQLKLIKGLNYITNEVEALRKIKI